MSREIKLKSPEKWKVVAKAVHGEDVLLIFLDNESRRIVWSQLRGIVEALDLEGFHRDAFEFSPKKRINVDTPVGGQIFFNVVSAERDVNKLRGMRPDRVYLFATDRWSPPKLFQWIESIGKSPKWLEVYD